MTSIRQLHQAADAARKAEDGFTGDDTSLSYVDAVNNCIRADTIMFDASAPLRGAAWEYQDVQTVDTYDALISAALLAHDTDVPAMCLIVSNSGPHGEPLACGYPSGHDGPHAWATLPTFTEAAHE